jgi:predicted metal-binding transcription factor (methanogenesis marker protein 9)
MIENNQTEKKITIKITDEQYNQIKKHLSEQGEINQRHETFSGYSFILSCCESGICWLELDMNKKIDLGDVDWVME